MVSRKWFERQSKSTLPAWQRISYYCYAHMRSDRHCPLASDELTRLVGKELKEVRRDIKLAIERDFLAYESNDRCLVAPYDYQFNVGNRSRNRCQLH